MELTWEKAITFSLIVAGATVLGLIVRKLLFSRLASLAEKTDTPYDDILIGLLRRPFILWSVLLGLWTAHHTTGYPPFFTQYIDRGILAVFYISLTLVGARGVSEFIGAASRTRESNIAVTSVFQHLAKAVIIAVGILIALESLGVNIQPLLAVFGVSSLAVAFGLQDTLTNLFSGIYVSASRTIRPGDYIRLDGGYEGVVVDIGWRATKIRALSNNVILIPNSKLAQSIVTNFHLPDKRMSVSIPVSVGFDEDPDRIEKILNEEVGQALRSGLKGLCADPAPSVRFNPGAGDFSLQFLVSVTVEEFTDQFLVQHELRKMFFKRLRTEGIAMPYPTRTVMLRQTP